MQSTSIARIIIAIITLLLCLALLGFGIFALVQFYWGLAFTCFLMSAGFGYFSMIDWKYFFGKKE